MKSDPIRGKTLRWTFDDGPMAGKGFEHVFGTDGKVTWHELEGDGQGSSTKAGAKEAATGKSGKESTRAGKESEKGATRTDSSAKYEVAAINDDVCAVSYLGESGFTLTTVLDFKKETVVAFASNEKQLLVQHGTFEIAGRTRGMK